MDVAKIGGAVVARVGIIRNFGCVGFGGGVYLSPSIRWWCSGGGGGRFHPPS